jgi:hypothetical protein
MHKMHYDKGMHRAAELSRLYVELLGRLPDDAGFKHHYNSFADLCELRAEFLRSEEHQCLHEARLSIRAKIKRKGREKNILMVGAYGNGNLGDKWLASVMLEFFEVHYPQIGTFYYSHQSISDYAIPDALKLRSDCNPLNRYVLQEFDAVLLGPGGLLACPHEPVWRPEFGNLCSVPFGIISCGCVSPLPIETWNVVRGATICTGRDEFTVIAMQAVRADAFVCPDPVLSCYRPIRPDEQLETGRAFILRGPLRAKHSEIAAIFKEGDVVIGMESLVDNVLLQIFPQMVFVENVEQLAATLGPHREVVSERYHGVVCGLLLGKKTFGLTRPDHNQSKILNLFESLNMSDFSEFDPHVRSASECDWNSINDRMCEATTNFKQAMARLVRNLIPNFSEP